MKAGRRYPEAATINAEARKAKLAEAGVRFNTVPNGVLVASQFGPSPIWLVMDGVRRGYVSRELFDRVHKEDAVVHFLENVEAIPEGAPFAADLELIQRTSRGRPKDPSSC